ncbi:hypothetical protein QE432_004853 [Agrobacterium sp. SORGH_AS 745]|nr:hypothetical protein [Agrobacterium tumefaciens]MDQ1223225.1 hypothetical protein [Agrobacterium sp. SORGH_AS_0745]
MAHDVAAMHFGHDAVVEMKIRTADCAGGHLDNRVAAVLDLWIGDTLTANVVLTVPGQGLHGRFSFQMVERQVRRVHA